MPRPFRYLLDPVPLLCIAAYLLYRFHFKHTALAEIPFFPNHFNDILCIPIFLPPLLYIHRQLGLRPHDNPPTPSEIFFHLVIWSLCFEVIAPRLPSLYRTTADLRDIAAYILGALLASLLWGTWRCSAAPNFPITPVHDTLPPSINA